MIENCLFKKNPSLTSEWDFDKNSVHTPYSISVGSNKKVWWICKHGHSWKATVNNRNNGKGCPYCSNHKVCEGNSLQRINPSLSKEWHLYKNGKLLPKDVVSGSSKKVWWKCESCHSSWEATVLSRNKGTGCPYCSGRKVNKTNCININEKLMKEWDYKKNKETDPLKLTSGSNKKVWWKCKQNHSWKATVYERNSRGTGCPYCNNKKIDDKNCLNAINTILSKQWDYEKNINLTPFLVGANSHLNAWWICQVCGYKWEASIIGRNNGFYKCKQCNSVSTKYPELMSEWDYDKNDLDPLIIAQSSNEKVWWKCKRSHSWETAISSRTNGKTNCPYCNKVLLKNDIVCDSFIDAFFYLKYSKQNLTFKYNQLYNNNGEFGRFRYDFYFPNEKKYVEVTSLSLSWIKKVGEKRWDQYMLNIDKKKKFVENVLNGEFEFIQIELNKNQMKMIRKNIKE